MGTLTKQRFKPFVIAIVATGILAPWNATAIDVANFSSFSFGNKFSTNYVEGLLVKSLLEITQGKLQQAQETADMLVSAAPNFKLAHLVRGDLLKARAQQLQTLGDTEAPSPEAVENLRDEARKRIERYLSHEPSANIPEPLWQLNGTQHHVIVVDTEKSRLYVYRNEKGKPQYVADYYVTIGKNGGEKHAEGDKRTPLGVYFAGTRLSRKLPDFYGEAAYPLNYPNEWDSYQGKNGHGIWLHGTPHDTYSRPPRASDGCVVMSNQDLLALAPILQQGNTPVIISSNLKWLEEYSDIAEKAELKDAIETWRQDWQEQDTERYLEHYSEDFFDKDGDNLDTWSQAKRRIQAGKPNVEIRLSNMSMYRYPDSRFEMAVVDFQQDFRSPQLQNKMSKRQYWIKENQQWKILYEGAA